MIHHYTQETFEWDGDRRLGGAALRIGQGKSSQGKYF
jgi:hypothetical protein